MSFVEKLYIPSSEIVFRRGERILFCILGSKRERVGIRDVSIVVYQMCITHRSVYKAKYLHRAV